MQTDELAGPPLRVALLPYRPGHSSFPQAGRQKFFPSISFSVEASSIDSASSFFSLRFLTVSNTLVNSKTINGVGKGLSCLPMAKDTLGDLKMMNRVAERSAI
jgi:hypothetical protein